MQAEKYQSFTTEDFLNDPEFIRFVREGDAEDTRFWTAYENSVVNLEAYRAAQKELKFIFTAKRIAMPASFETDLLARIEQSVDQQQRKKTVSRRLYLSISSAAAILAFVLLSFWLNTANVTVITRYGEKKSVTLPDGSIVMLNANSSIKYPLLWRINHRRHVELKGEAYFKVVHLNNDPINVADKDRFLVNTNRLHIEVLGTEFDVKDRNQTAKISLTKGRVSVLSLVSGKHYILQPKQMALETTEEALKIVQADPSVEHAWVDGNRKMQKTKVKDILQEFADVYGRRVVLSDPAMAEVQIDGTISFKSGETVLFVLANILNANVKKDSTTIILQAK
ncbi:FecR family protein [Pedobacter westerhofensis]|uniref:FecR family protein n=1 Tax=Pedobacter westerhofensis TaxID=425512 RepID=A0A521FS28_9SPHI|nr:FecR domain-containing protein [Pedobacter westerhofensis]SMO99035.1 FecR family protein [Pedobacter westerhofensis]